MWPTVESAESIWRSLPRYPSVGSSNMFLKVRCFMETRFGDLDRVNNHRRVGPVIEARETSCNLEGESGHGHGSFFDVSTPPSRLACALKQDVSTQFVLPRRCHAIRFWNSWQRGV